MWIVEKGSGRARRARRRHEIHRLLSMDSLTFWFSFRTLMMRLRAHHDEYHMGQWYSYPEGERMTSDLVLGPPFGVYLYYVLLPLVRTLLYLYHYYPPHGYFGVLYQPGMTGPFLLAF